MTTRCLSIFHVDAPHVLANHKHYSSRMGYEHTAVSMAGMQGKAQRTLLKYELVLHHLRQMPEMALLVCFSEDCLVLNMYPVEPMAEGRQHLLPSLNGNTGSHQAAVQVWRNTKDIRNFIVRCIGECKIGGATDDEETLLAPLDVIEPMGERGGVTCAMFCNPRFTPVWATYPNLWTIVMDEEKMYGYIHPSFRNALAEHINDCQQKGARLLDFSAHANVPAEPFSVYNPGQPIALVTYYTANVREYGAIAELNFKRYCERHGYTLYVYRDTPAEVEPGTTGTWLKPWFLRKYLPHHEWVMWVDADILFVDQSKPLEPLFANRDLLAAHDIGPWIINAGVLGFKRTDHNVEFVEEIYRAVSAAPDKSSTYANGGDQTIIANLLRERLDWALEDGLDCIGINTPWYFQQPSSLMVHFLAIQSPMRAMLMSQQERVSLQLN
ncbi:hypothetical protein P9250_15120 [Caballeronia sp. LP006]|uniref:hypothetical protein n=1 Tax=unclassified Caballeronia TaxID=2646786 RepID=UPI0020288AEA|nr:MULTISPECIES: hypothetical protein [unclassified Caballeronia]MDR5776112.1 hypothetical protein [Caballeronia sp. LZ002]MDR5801026.1 hypothetical protein [Caballeronia sp. LZ001]MDR5829217.1 hypothetical protein [Caballeronia sp. LP006]MDR5851552.1 hypothetical protein [Caballeronia sp. LZ003]